MTDRRPTPDELLAAVDLTRRTLLLSKGEYEKAVLAAHERGVSNVRIAGRAGVTETAIRQMIARASARVDA